MGVLRDLGHEVVSEAGAASADDSCDYPDVAFEVCRRVGDDAGAFGLLVCGTGQGMAMTANRMTGIRAAACSDVFSARMARAHNDANVLCLGQRVLGIGVATSILEAFLGVEFEGGRHSRRVAKLDGGGG
jgi:ribose 5-phosphate isomerase B